MDNLIRLLLRLLLVPLGFFAAAIAGSLVIMVGAWDLVAIAASGHPDGPAYALFGAAIGGPILFVLVVVLTLLPASIGILISEGFAIRSWIFHALNGALSAWLGWQLFERLTAKHLPLDRPMVLIVAGIAGGFAYWGVAGWNAGFWKPVFARAAAASPAPPAIPR
jgi:hypothetical protein